VNDRAAERLTSGQAWQDFCAVLRLAGDTIDEMDEGVTELDRAEWYRCVTRILRVACERYLENTEPERPRLRITPWRTSINVQSPDQDHLLCEFPGVPREYRITGNRGTVPYFVIASMTAPHVADPGATDWAPRGLDGLADFDPSKSHALASIASDDIVFDAAGNFELIVSREAHPANWLPLHDDSVGLIVRTVHHDRSRETAPTFAIREVDAGVARPRRADEMSDGLARAAQMTLGFVNRFREWKRDLAREPNHIEFSLERYLSHGGVADRQFGFGVWQKPERHALVIEFDPPECEYWNFQLCNIWQENLDNYEDGQGYLTKFTARPEADGSIRVVVADHDPGLGGNWVDSFGHTSGLMGLRFVKTAGAAVARVRLVEL
jgi:hypothetical protein